jgi:hypothetical protein
MKKILTGLHAIIFLLMVTMLFIYPNIASSQVVSPLQSGHFMPTVNNIRDMGYPPPGLFLLWYNLSISTDTYVDKNGNELTNLDLSQIDPNLPDLGLKIKVDGWATVPALAWGSSFSLLGGAKYVAAISPSYASAEGIVITERGAGAGDTTITEYSEGKVSGWGDLFVSPLQLYWTFGKFDLATMYGFYAPTGRYESGADDNMGLGFWTHQFQGYGYYYPFPDKSTAIMLGLTYELTGDIKDEDVNTGNRFTLEWGLSQYLSEQFEIGVQGGHNWQISDDSGSDVFWDPGIHDRKSTVAFSAAFWPWTNKFYIAGKYAFDFGVKQRFKNNYWMLNFILLTGLLTGES